MYIEHLLTALFVSRTNFWPCKTWKLKLDDIEDLITQRQYIIQALGMSPSQNLMRRSNYEDFLFYISERTTCIWLYFCTTCTSNGELHNVDDRLKTRKFTGFNTKWTLFTYGITDLNLHNLLSEWKGILLESMEHQFIKITVFVLLFFTYLPESQI